ncbi:Spermidine/putrescine import ATP-binding protein PotA [Tepidimonas sediminis]|uniref:Spermidine/putrescine import ATP-binding protein PotA n=1 Tax=Tepidimonas sediminis TaxID=2588941 RepID=A0A554WM48_9BURK|nr:ABC transporter ATP-binding protein [Tepidimonas sediminis]TSE24640.1 Spermidine/putrescine import ATP-binding protein PotA [Tepidimonas sediminis]
MAANPLVTFDAVQKTYDGKHLVVRDLHLTIETGEFISLLGPSGSGKTTTLMMLAGFETPTAGRILLRERDITHTPPHKRHFGMVFQDYALFPHMTVAENIAYPLTVRRLDRAERERRIRRALDMVQMVALADRYPAQLSGGQRQRVALARALVFDPQLVLMDEPLGALDKQLREHMQLELKALHRRLGLTFVYVTHDQSEALTMSDRVAVFNDGIIQQIDPVERLYETPVNRFVATFVGDSTNLPGTVAAAREGGVIVDVGGGVRLTALNVNAAGPGTPVTCCIRPERIGVLADDETASDNVLMATVEDVIYFGDHVRLRCRHAQHEITVKRPLVAAPVQPGQPIRLHLPAQHLRAYR